ncbi:competence type IV pilus minor pilin ComGD [Desemzia sp. FAM 23991]|uniref:competence type IV pilus minor pilin ComGD n=1 Tax=unclassified Desemzia TaxID=2685243 RepID=UPI00388A7F64
MLKNQKGFLLLESLLVLSIAASLVLIPQLMSRSATAAIEGDLFKRNLESSVTATQNYAVLSGKMTKVELFRQNRKITFTVLEDKNHPFNHTLFFPESVSSLTNAIEIYFLGGSGNIKNLDSITFNINGENTKLKFQLGSGRYDWE